MAAKKKEEETKEKSSKTSTVSRKKIENSKNVTKKSKNTSTKNTSAKKTTTKKKTTVTSAKKNTNSSQKTKTQSNQTKNSKNISSKTDKKPKTTATKAKKVVPKKQELSEKPKEAIQQVEKIKETQQQRKTTNIFNKISSQCKNIGNRFLKLFSRPKTEKKKKVEKVTKSQKKKDEKQVPILTKKTKKIFLIIMSICILILVLEGIFVLIFYVQRKNQNTYYDSLNGLDLDGSNMVAVGSSDFYYSKYNGYTKGTTRAKIIKYDADGKILFEKMYEKGLQTTFNSIITVSDGYVVVGTGIFSEEEQKNEAKEAMIIKFDKEGNILWEKFYQVITDTSFNKVIKTSDGYVAIGQSIYANMEMGNHTTGGGIIVKYDLNGNEVWHNNHGGTKSGNFNDIIEVGGNFYVVGKDATDSANLIKYNQNGEYQWHKNYSYTDGIGFTGITYLDNALYVVGSKKILPEGTGDDDDRSTTNTDALLVKYDLDGNVQEEKTFGGSNYERYNSILTYINELYVIGHTTSKDAGIKVETDGERMTGILVRYDKAGNILKKEVFGGSGNDNLTGIITDGVSIYMTGYSNSKNGNITTSKDNGKDYFGKVIKIDFKFRELIVK